MTADSQLVINVATAFFIKHFIGSKPFLILTCLNINLKLLITGCNQASYVSKGTCLECLPPLGKSSTSLVKGIAWCLVSQTSASWWGVGN